ncbi:hypothetical protein [Mycobacterium nebraskense]|uniref:Uncharacterized protein n=1 Tax=Mycobacterium nebraskense TaxID=244292 RepID=A0A0F5NAH7_9MYCO|nr:hypothetical protein [Mycobacterium nebraskense]KKC03957.1 hypothetical protein WU83_16245 [Mycobacterium nebraskense]KLO34101.1 hypothetical protein ABW17_26980 [Mycobacterium nebraskense]MBI2696021.1 hypothetical protein [Mycobacterium nebraskense]MCV7116442.1 hypothetical protein [Mycobacterium nebraskense]ORW34783.1 hypothetical protein AWC17_23485 [Mycobacterium nebraskense]
MLGFLRNLSEIGKLPTALRDELDAEGIIFSAGKVGVSRHFGGHVPGVYSASGVSRYTGAFAFTAARIVATLPTRGDANLRSIDCSWDSSKGPGRATITGKGLQLEIDLHGVDPAFSGSMRLNYRKKIPDDVLETLPTTTLRFPVQPVFVYRAAGVRPKT